MRFTCDGSDSRVRNRNSSWQLLEERGGVLLALLDLQSSELKFSGV